MKNPRETRTNAADSAPGVDDGPAGVTAPPVNSKPRGRGAVFLGVIVVCLILFVIMLVPRQDGRDESGRMVSTGTTEAEVNTSQVPGAAERQPATPPATQPGY